MIAKTHVIGTAVFAIYVADALGYTGSVAILLFKDLVAGDASRLDFFRSFTFGHTVVPDKIQATFANGVLSVELPKIEAKKPIRVQIS